MERPCITKTPTGLSWLASMVPPLPLPHSLAGIWDGRFDGHTLTVRRQAKRERGGRWHSSSPAGPQVVDKVGENGSEDWLDCRLRLQFKLVFGPCWSAECVYSWEHYTSFQRIFKTTGGWLGYGSRAASRWMPSRQQPSGTQIKTHFRPSKCSRVYCLSFMHLSLKQWMR